MPRLGSRVRIPSPAPKFQGLRGFDATGWQTSWARNGRVTISFQACPLAAGWPSKRAISSSDGWIYLCVLACSATLPQFLLVLNCQVAAPLKMRQDGVKHRQADPERVADLGAGRPRPHAVEVEPDDEAQNFCRRLGDRSLAWPPRIRFAHGHFCASPVRSSAGHNLRRCRREASALPQPPSNGQARGFPAQPGAVRRWPAATEGATQIARQSFPLHRAPRVCEIARAVTTLVALLLRSRCCPLPVKEPPA